MRALITPGYAKAPPASVVPVQGCTAQGAHAAGHQRRRQRGGCRCGAELVEWDAQGLKCDHLVLSQRPAGTARRSFCLQMALRTDGLARPCAAGDLHGQFGDLQRIFQRLGRPGSDDKVWIFLGDYIDRGEGEEVTVFQRQANSVLGRRAKGLQSRRAAAGAEQPPAGARCHGGEVCRCCCCTRCAAEVPPPCRPCRQGPWGWRLWPRSLRSSCATPTASTFFGATTSVARWGGAAGRFRHGLGWWLLAAAGCCCQPCTVLPCCFPPTDHGALWLLRRVPAAVHAGGVGGGHAGAALLPEHTGGGPACAVGRCSCPCCRCVAHFPVDG